MKQSPIALLCAALAACVGDDTTGDEAIDDDTVGEAEVDLVVSPESGHTFFATNGNGVIIRVTDTEHTAFVPGFTVYDPAGNSLTRAWSQNVAGTSFQAPTTGTYTVRVYDAVYDASSGHASTGDYQLSYTRTPRP